MKRTYSKPSLLIENFELMEHIALSCGRAAGETNHWDMDTCGFNLGGPGNEDDLIIFRNENCRMFEIGDDFSDTQPWTNYNGEEIQYGVNMFSS